MLNISGKLVRPNKTNINSKYFIQDTPNLIITPRNIKSINVKKPTIIAVFDDNMPGSNNKFIAPRIADKKIRFEDLIYFGLEVVFIKDSKYEQVY